MDKQSPEYAKKMIDAFQCLCELTDSSTMMVTVSIELIAELKELRAQSASTCFLDYYDLAYINGLITDVQDTRYKCVDLLETISRWVTSYMGMVSKEVNEQSSDTTPQKSLN